MSFETDREIRCAIISDGRTGALIRERRLIQCQCIRFIIINGGLSDLPVFIVFCSEDISFVILSYRFSVDIEIVFGFTAVHGLIGHRLDISGRCRHICRRGCSVFCIFGSGVLFGSLSRRSLVLVFDLFYTADSDLDVLFNVFDGIGSVAALLQCGAAGLYREILSLPVTFGNFEGEAEAVSGSHGSISLSRDRIALSGGKSDLAGRYLFFFLLVLCLLIFFLPAVVLLIRLFLKLRNRFFILVPAAGAGISHLALVGLCRRFGNCLFIVMPVCTGVADFCFH